MICSIIIRFSTLRLVWKSLKVLNHQSQDTPVDEVDFELLQLWCLLAFHTVLVYSGVEAVLGFIIPFYYYFKMVLCIATFLPGTKVPNFLFHVAVVPAIESLHTLVTSDLPSLLHFLKDELHILPLKLVDWLFLPGAFCLDLPMNDSNVDVSSSDEDDETEIAVELSEINNEENTPQNTPLPPQMDDFSTPPPTFSPTNRTPLAPVKRKRHNNEFNDADLPGLLSPVKCSLIDHIAASYSMSPLSSVSRPLFPISPSQEAATESDDGAFHINRGEIAQSSNRKSDIILPKLVTEDEAVHAITNDTAMGDDDDMSFSSDGSTVTCIGSKFENLVGNLDTTGFKNHDQTSDEVGDVVDENSSSPLHPVRMGRPSLTGHVRAILTGSSDISVREFYLDLRSPRQIHNRRESTVTEETERAYITNNSNAEEELHFKNDSAKSIVQTSTTTIEETTVAAPSNAPHVSTRKSLRLRKKLIYYR